MKIEKRLKLLNCRLIVNCFGKSEYKCCHKDCFDVYGLAKLEEYEELSGMLPLEKIVK